MLTVLPGSALVLKHTADQGYAVQVSDTRMLNRSYCGWVQYQNRIAETDACYKLYRPRMMRDFIDSPGPKHGQPSTEPRTVAFD